MTHFFSLDEMVEDHKMVEDHEMIEDQRSEISEYFLLTTNH